MDKSEEGQKDAEFLHLTQVLEAQNQKYLENDSTWFSAGLNLSLAVAALNFNQLQELRKLSVADTTEK